MEWGSPRRAVRHRARRRWWIAGLAGAVSLAGPPPARAVDCALGPVGLGCPPGAQVCTVLSASSPGDCVLDFGSRAVVFKGVFDVGTSLLDVRAREITVAGTLRARSDGGSPGGRILLTATGALTVTTGRLDVSGNSAGQIALRAGAVEIQPNGALVARGVDATTPNGASGGLVDVVAAGGILHRGTLDVTGGSAGAGGSVVFLAGTDVVIGQRIEASGGAQDGGDVDLTAGDDVRIERPIDVASTTGGAGGAIRARAGIDAVGGLRPGGRLDVLAGLFADGSGDADGGYDGGDVTLSAFGTVAIAAGVPIHADGGAPDGTGGTVAIDTTDAAPGHLGPLDGDAQLAGGVTLRGVGAEGDGGSLDVTAGRDALVDGPTTVDGGSAGGDVALYAGRHVTITGAIAADGRAAAGSGGSVSVKAGFATLGTATLARSVDLTSKAGGAPGDAILAGCSLVVDPGVTIDAASGNPSGGAAIDLIARRSLALGAASRILAPPAGAITLRHPPGVVPQIGTGVVFTPAAQREIDAASPFYPPCPVCGDGILQAGEPCDDGNVAGGDCCAADCSAATCATASPTPTVTPSATSPTPSRTPTRTATPPPVTPTATAPTATPTPPPLSGDAALACTRALGRTTTALIATDLDALATCGLEAFACVQGAAAERASCLAAGDRRCAKRLARRERARQAFGQAFAEACAGLPLPDLLADAGLGFARLEPTCIADLAVPLRSADAIAACVQVGSACTAERGLAFALPRVDALVPLLPSAAAASFCVGPPGAADGAGDPSDARTAVRCQKAAAVAARALAKRQLGTARACVESLAKCRFAGGDAAACAGVADACAARLAALDDPRRGLQARVGAALARACDEADPALLSGPSGLGFEAVAPACAALGAPLDGTAASVSACLARGVGCSSSRVLRHALPGADGELARVGLALEGPTFCPPDAPPTPTASPTPVAAPSSTPAFPPSTTRCGDGVLDPGEECDVGDTRDGDGCDAACRVEALVLGGGSAASDCVVAWAVMTPPDGAPGAGGTGRACTDGDPRCDADGARDGTCTFRAALCVRPPAAASTVCAAPPALAGFTIESPRPTAADPVDGANAAAVLAAFGRLADGPALGRAGNRLALVPPLAPRPPDHCTDAATLRVPLHHLETRRETFRTRATTLPAPGHARGLRDDDTLVLGCRRAPP